MKELSREKERNKTQEREYQERMRELDQRQSSLEKAEREYLRRINEHLRGSWTDSITEITKAPDIDELIQVCNVQSDLCYPRFSRPKFSTPKYRG